MSGGEWMPYKFALLHHERIMSADLRHVPLKYRERTRRAMRDLYWEACVQLQKARSNDGLISKLAIWGRLDVDKDIADELEKVGMLESRGEFYYPRNYLEQNRSGDQIRAAESNAAKRKQISRAKKVRSHVGHTSVTRDTTVAPVCDSVCVFVSSSLPDSSPDLPPPVGSARAIPPEGPSGVHEVAEPETAKDRYVLAYCAGIAKGKGGPFAWSGSAYDMGDLGQLITVFAHERATKKPLRGERLLGFIEAAACDFATWVGEQKDPDTPRYYSGYRPKGCLKFLNEQERSEEARRVG